MSQNYDKAKLLHRLWNEENARRTAFGMPSITMEQFIQLNQATEEELRTGQLDNRRRSPKYRQNRTLTIQERRLMANAFRGAVTGIQRGGSFAQDYWKLAEIDKEIQNIGIEGTTLIQNAQQYGQGVIKSKEFQAFTDKTSELSKTVMEGIIENLKQGVDILTNTVGQANTEQILRTASQAKGVANQGLGQILTSGDAIGINNAFKTKINVEQAEELRKMGGGILSFLWNNLPSWENIYKIGSTIWGAFKIITSEVPEADILDVKLKF